MTVFGIGSLELILILLILILIFGPERINEIGKNLGRAYRKFTGITDEIDQQVRQVRSAVTKTVNLPDLAKPLSETSDEIKSLRQEVKKEIKPLAASISPRPGGITPAEEEE